MVNNARSCGTDEQALIISHIHLIGTDLFSSLLETALQRSSEAAVFVQPHSTKKNLMRVSQNFPKCHSSFASYSESETEEVLTAGSSTADTSLAAILGAASDATDSLEELGADEQTAEPPSFKVRS